MGAIIVPPEYNQQLGQNLGSIAQSIATAINPTHDLQVGMRNAIAADPTLAQKLADLNDASPGILDHMGLGGVGKEIARIPPSQAQVIKKATAARLKAAAEGTGGDEAVSRELTGQTIAGNEAQKGEAKQQQALGAQADILSQMINDPNTPPALKHVFGILAATRGRTGDVTKEMLGAEDYDMLQGNLKKLPNTDIHQLAEDFIDGKADRGLAMAAAYDPATRDLFNASMADIRSQRMADIYAMKTERQGDMHGKAFQLVQQSANQVPMDVALKMAQGDQATLDRIAELQRNPSSARPGEEGLASTAAYYNNLQQANKVRDANLVLGNWSKLTKGLTNLEGDAAAERVTALKAIIPNVNRATGMNIDVKLEDGKAVFYENGKKVPQPQGIVDRVKGWMVDMVSGNNTDDDANGNSSRSGLSKNQDIAVQSIRAAGGADGKNRSAMMAEYNKFKMHSPMTDEEKAQVGKALGLE